MRIAVTIASRPGNAAITCALANRFRITTTFPSTLLSEPQTPQCRNNSPADNPNIRESPILSQQAWLIGQCKFRYLRILRVPHSNGTHIKRLMPQ